MEDLLFGLTPAEWWVWSYLVLLAQEQGSAHIILPRPGEDQRAERVFSRKHLKRLLQSLRSKRALTNLIIPPSKNRQIEILIPASKIGDAHVLNGKKGDLGVPNIAARGTCMSPKSTLGTSMSPNNNIISIALPDCGPHQAKLKEKLEKLLKLKQQEIKGALDALKEREIFQARIAMRSLCRYEPKGNEISEKAKLYAVIRFIQSEEIEKPQAWIDQVARAREREIWKEGLSGSDGK
jgi:hypothetical protein